MKQRPSTGALLVDGIRLDHEGGACVASANLDGERLWFSTRDAELGPAPEAFATAALIPAAAEGRSVRVDGPLGPVWMENARRALELLKRKRNRASCGETAPRRPGFGWRGVFVWGLTSSVGQARAGTPVRGPGVLVAHRCSPALVRLGTFTGAGWGRPHGIVLSPIDGSWRRTSRFI